MSKSILMSIRKKWWDAETSSIDLKSIEVRKTAPIDKDVIFPIKVYVYVPEKKAVCGNLLINKITFPIPANYLKRAQNFQ